jgi:signal transduction histidine kinase
MIIKHSLRFRIVVVFCIFGTLLVAIYGSVVFALFASAEDDLFTNRLKAEAEDFSDKYRRVRNTFPPRSRYLQGYIGTDDMPDIVKEMVKELPVGFYETGGPSSIGGPDSYHVAVHRLPQSDDLLYLIYDVEDLEITEKRSQVLVFILIAGFALVAVIGILIGILSANRVVTPLRYLSDMIQRSGPENLPTDFSKQFYADEIGFIASTLEQSMERIKSFVERERLFTRDASHELRTPLTVIKGAVELLQQSPLNKERRVNRPLNRIDRSVNEMEDTIETFLWLAREEETADKDLRCEVLPIVQSEISRHQPLMENKAIEIEVIPEDALVLPVPEQVLRIAFTNIIRNSISYTYRERITVKVCRNRIEVSDTGQGISADDLKAVTQPHVCGNESPGLGLGLPIVKRLCDRFGWRLEIGSEVGQGTTVQLLFQPFLE